MKIEFKVVKIKFHITLKIKLFNQKLYEMTRKSGNVDMKYAFYSEEISYVYHKTI